MKSIKKNLLSSYQLIKKNKRVFATSYAADLLTLALFIILVTVTWVPVVETFDKVQQTMGTIQAADVESISELMQSQSQLTTYISTVVKYLLLFILGGSLIYLLFQGIAWYSAHKLAKHKVKPKIFSLHFLLISGGGFIIFYLISFITNQIYSFANSSPLNLVKYNPFNPITLTFFIVLLYTIMSAYGSCTAQKWYKKFHKTLINKENIPPFLISVVLVFAVNYLMSTIFEAGYIKITLLWAVIIVPLTYSFTRVYFVHSLKN